MVLLVTSASGDGSGYGKLLAFDADGALPGPFSEDARIVDRRGVGVDDSLLSSTVARTAFWQSPLRASSLHLIAAATLHCGKPDSRNARSIRDLASAERAGKT